MSDDASRPEERVHCSWRSATEKCRFRAGLRSRQHDAILLMARSLGRANIPEGPAIWIFGDCHVGNLGAVANTQGELAIQVRDLDQTVIGNPAHDLIRLALSLAMAARGSDPFLCDLPLFLVLCCFCLCCGLWAAFALSRRLHSRRRLDFVHAGAPHRHRHLVVHRLVRAPKIVKGHPGTDAGPRLAAIGFRCTSSYLIERHSRR